MRRTKRRTKRRRTRRGGGIFSGEIVSSDKPSFFDKMKILPNRYEKREEYRRQCMIATNHKYSYEKLIKKCGRSDDMWVPSMKEQYDGATPVNVTYYYSNEYSPPDSSLEA